MRSLVIGAGEVGSALSLALSADIRDIEEPKPVRKYPVLVIAFGWHEGFADTVRRYIELHGEPGCLVIIASTVHPSIYFGTDWVHLSIRGRHPNLYESIRDDEHWAGGPRAEEAADYLLHHGLNVAVTEKAETVAVGKLIELAEFGVQVTAMYRAKAICDKLGADFDVAYTKMHEDYNSFWEWMDDPRFRFPVLEYSPPPIGAHCVSPGIELLGDDWFISATQGYRSSDRAKGVAL